MKKRMNTTMTLSKNKVVLGLSGGVDSTSAALLLKEKGFEVIGFYFDVLGNHEAGRAAAENLAMRLDMQFIAKDVSADFERIVIDNFCREYSCGRTPNPCTLCNPTIKFKELIDIADQVGAYYIATGHYAKIREINGAYFVERGAVVVFFEYKQTKYSTQGNKCRHTCPFYCTLCKQ